MTRVLYRCDLALLGADVFALDMYRAGADPDGQGLMLRQTHKIEKSAAVGSQPEADHYQVTEDGLRLRLRPADTAAGLYSTSEWATGPAEHFDQSGLERAAAAGDPRCFGVGREMAFRVRFSPAYADGTALGTAGMIGQDWSFGADRADDVRAVRDYELAAVMFTYLGPQSGLFGRLVARSRTPRLAVMTMDYVTGTVWARPLVAVDVAAWHTYGIRWEPDALVFTVDGGEIARFRQGQRTANIGVARGKWSLPVRPGFVRPVALQPDVWLDNNTARRPRMDDRCAFGAEQWIDVAWFEMRA